MSIFWIKWDCNGWCLSIICKCPFAYDVGVWGVLQKEKHEYHWNNAFFDKQWAL